MKFSDLLGEPEPEETPADPPVERPGAPAEPDPITVFAPVPMPDRPTPSPSSSVPVPPVPPGPAPAAPRARDEDAAIPTVAPPADPPPDPVLDAPPAAPPRPLDESGGRSDLASLNVHQPAPAPPRASVVDQLVGLDEVVDDLLPPRRGRR